MANSKYIARYATHIQEDLERGWSSWNFGQEGFEGTRGELEEYLEECTDECPVFISQIEFYPNDLSNADIRELYPNYWVVVDNENARNELSCIELDNEEYVDAVSEAIEADYSGDGDSFDPDDYERVGSFDDGCLHVFIHVDYL